MAVSASPLQVVVDGAIYKCQPQGGISRMFNEILPRMCTLETRLQIRLFTETGSLKQPLPTHPGIQRLTIPRFDRYLRPWRLWRPLLPFMNRSLRHAWLGTGRGQIWHSTFFSTPQFWRGPQLATFYDMIPERFPEQFCGDESDRWRAQRRQAALEADLIMAISQTTAADLCQFYGISPQRCRVTHLGPSDLFLNHAAAQTAPRDRASTAPFILYVGHRGGYKNFETLLAAYGNWQAQRDVALLVVGGPPFSKAENDFLNTHGLQSRVRRLTDVNDHALAVLYGTAAAFVYPSRYEGFGIPLLEAMSCGCPVVASRVPSTIEVAGEHPFYFDPDSAEDLQTALTKAFTEGRDAPRCRAAQQHARRYSWDLTAEKTLAIYRELLT